jgi:hypothetical protein
MASVEEQLAAARAAHLAASSVEVIVRDSITQVLDAWERGEVSDQQVRHQLENVIRGAYRTSAAVALAHTKEAAGLPKWNPKSSVFRTEYLGSLLSDVRRNLREYKASDRSETARRRAALRMQLSAAVGAQRGYTDMLIEAHAELEEKGFSLRKVWLANFVNNFPCEHCRELHGTVVKLREEFKVQTSDSPKVYVNLQGPPRHPNCQCYLCIVIENLETALSDINIETPAGPRLSATSADIRQMPSTALNSIIASLRATVETARGSR